MRTAKPVRSEHILDAAARLFGERPYHEVRMEDIAAKAGVSKGGIYLRFKDKEDLHSALVLHSLQRLRQAVQTTIAPLRTPEEKLSTVVREGVRFFHKAPYFLELIQRIDVSRSAVHTTALHDSRKQFDNLLIGIFDELNASGRWLVRDPELSALALGGMMCEILRWSDEDSECLANKIVQLFLHGISKS